MRPTGILPVVAPGRKVVVDPTRAKNGTVGPQGRAAKPEVPVQPRLHALFRQIAGAARAAYSHRDALYLADAPTANKLARLPEVSKDIGTLLASRLQDALMFPHRIYAPLGFGQGQG